CAGINFQNVHFGRSPANSAQMDEAGVTNAMPDGETVNPTGTAKNPVIMPRTLFSLSNTGPPDMPGMIDPSTTTWWGSRAHGNCEATIKRVHTHLPLSGCPSPS